MENTGTRCARLGPPSDAVAVDRRRPVTAPAGARTHLAARPIWLCRACGRPWPCDAARSSLLAEYARDRVALSIYLAQSLYEAADDLARLHPDQPPDPAELFDRFVGWPARRTPIRPDPGQTGPDGRVSSGAWRWYAGPAAS